MSQVKLTTVAIPGTDTWRQMQSKKAEMLKTQKGKAIYKEYSMSVVQWYPNKTRSAHASKYVKNGAMFRENYFQMQG